MQCAKCRARDVVASGLTLHPNWCWFCLFEFAQNNIKNETATAMLAKSHPCSCGDHILYAYIVCHRCQKIRSPEFHGLIITKEHICQLA